MEIKIHQSNRSSGHNVTAHNTEEAKKIVNQLIDKDTVEITITQKEWKKGRPVTANGDKFSSVDNHYR